MQLGDVSDRPVRAGPLPAGKYSLYGKKTFLG